jgi:hypothetical protein
VGRAESADDLDCVVERIPEVHAFARDEAVKRLAVDVFHDEEIGADIEQSADIGMVE